MPAVRFCWWSLVLAALACASGCAWVPRSRLAASESLNQSLVAKTRSLEGELYNLESHSRDLENQLADAESQLAALEQRYGTDRRNLARYRSERNAALGYGRSLPGDITARLEQLARDYPSLKYDPETGVARLDEEVLFDTGSAELRPVAQQLLDQFAALFRSPAARDFKFMVVGHTDNRNIRGGELRAQYPNNFHLSAARSLAVLDFMNARGIEEDRLGLGGFGRHQPLAANDTPEHRQRNRRVEIFIIGPEVPVVGWTETIPTLY